MTSDDLFWRILLASNSHEEAALLWWLAVFKADERPYREPARTLERVFRFSRSTVFRARSRLEPAALISTRVQPHRSTEFTLEPEPLTRFLAHRSLGQTEMVRIESAPLQFDPFRGHVLGLPAATAGARLCMLRDSREESLLLVWLFQVGAARNPVRISSRDLASLLLGLIDRRTAMRAMDRLASAGLVSVSPMGRAGTEYSLNGDALHALVHQPFPFHEDAAAVMPGWANLDFPLLHRLDQAVSAQTTPAADDAAMEV